MTGEVITICYNLLLTSTSVYTSKIVPTAMIFARCRDGISHSPDEYTSPEEYV